MNAPAHNNFRPGFWTEGIFGTELRFECPLPPPDNHCHSSAKGGTRYPTKEYKAWLEHTAPLLQETLDDWQPDTSHWWQVWIDLWLGSTGDGQNYIKPLLDLLSGAYVVSTAFDDAKGRRIGKGTILKPGALWNDDCRVWEVRLRVQEVRHATPYAQITAALCPGPRDWKANQQAQERAAKERAKQAEIDARTIATTRREWFNWMDFHGGKEFTSARSRVRKAIRDATGHLVSVTFTPGEWAKLQNGGAK